MPPELLLTVNGRSVNMIALLKEIVGAPLSKSVIGLLAALGTIATIREVLLPEPAQAVWNFHRLWTLSWPWWLWVMMSSVAMLVVVSFGAVGAVRARELRIRELQDRVCLRPWLTVAYSHNATEDDWEIPDTLIIENVGDEAAFAISIVTEPPGFRNAVPRLGLPLNA